MRAAPKTWALVVGIDDYDAAPKLTGAVADAVAVAQWLKALGVPDEQVLFHAAPGAAGRKALAGAGLTVRGCTEPDIWASVYELSRQSGERLFVFLCGHGLYEPGSGRLFLTKEAGTLGAYTNLGIDAYSQHFRTMSFPRQFLVMDGCLNYPYSLTQRSQIQAAMHAGIALQPPRADTTLVRCFAAGQGEKALEVGGRGLFTSQLLPVLDPAGPAELATYLDDQAGVRLVDLRRAVNEVAGPQVAAIAHDQGRRQTTSCEVEGAGAAATAVPVIELVPPGTARVRVVVNPGQAIPDVKQIRISSFDTFGQRVVPVPPATSVTVPVVSVVPVGTTLMVNCLLRPGASWNGAGYQQVTVDADRDVRFDFAPPVQPARAAVPPRAPVSTTVHTVDQSGAVVFGMTGPAYRTIDRLLAGTRLRISLERHETGPVLRASRADRELLDEVTARVAQAVNQETSPEVHVAITRTHTAGEVTTGVRLALPRGGPVALAGALVDVQVLQIEDRDCSLSEIAAQPVAAAGPGAVPVRLRLPWGSWSTMVHLAAGTTKRVALPASVGVPPLRVAVLAKGDRSWRTGGSIVATDRRTVTARIRAGLRGAPTEATPWGRIAELPGRTPIAFPLHPYTGVAVSRSGVVRVEPLSDLPRPEWDLLVSSGRLDVLDGGQARDLARQKMAEPMLGVAGAYACFALDEREYLALVLRNLRRLDGDIPDVAVLAATSDRLAGRHDARNREELVRLLDRPGAVPLFRWGVPLAILAARHYDLPTYAEALSSVEARLYPESVWTCWQPDRT